MGGLSGHEINFRRQSIKLPYWHNESMESRTEKLVCGTPYEVLLGMLCHDTPNVDRAAAFFLSLYQQWPEAVSGYLRGFFERLYEECNIEDFYLEAKPEKARTAIDFPRPSVARMLVGEFFALLSENAELHSVLSKVDGISWFLRFRIR